MYGDVYNFSSYTNQQILIDLKNFSGTVAGIRCEFYQLNDFVKENGKRLPNSTYDESKRVWYQTDEGARIPVEPDLRVKNLKCILGYYLEGVQDKELRLYTADSDIYKGSGVTKKLYLRWFMQTEDGFKAFDELSDGNMIETIEDDSFETIEDGSAQVDELIQTGISAEEFWANKSIYLYKFDKSLEEEEDFLVGPFWHRVASWNDFDYNKIEQGTSLEGQFVIRPVYKTIIRDVDDDKPKYDETQPYTYQSGGDIVINSTNHKINNINNTNLIKKDESAIKTIKDPFEIEIQISGNDTSLDSIKYKALIVQRDLVNYVYNYDELDNFWYIKNPDPPSFPTGTSEDGMSETVSGGVIERKQRPSDIGITVEDSDPWYIAPDPIIYSSNELTFRNEEKIDSTLSLNSIKNLKLNCLDSSNGIYRVYNTLDNKIVLRHDNQTIQASFDITTIAGVDCGSVTVKWRYPKDNTMFNGEQPVTEGDGAVPKVTKVEYRIYDGKLEIGDLVKEKDPSESGSSESIEYDSELYYVKKNNIYYPISVKTIKESEGSEQETKKQILYIENLGIPWDLKYTTYIKTRTEEDVDQSVDSNDYSALTWTTNGEFYEGTQVIRIGRTATDGLQTIKAFFNYGIKDYYSSLLTNNTITCIVIRNDNVQNVEKTFSFGHQGVNGTDYSFDISLDKYQFLPFSRIDPNDRPKVKVKAFLASPQEVLPTDFVQWSLEKCSTHESGDTSVKDVSIYSSSGSVSDPVSGSEIQLQFNGSVDDESLQNFYCLLKAEVRTSIRFSDENESNNSTGTDPNAGTSSSEREVVLEAYLPIGIGDKDEVKSFIGGTSIVYNSLGTEPIYYNDEFYLLDKDKNKIDDKWEVLPKEQILLSQTNNTSFSNEEQYKYIPNSLITMYQSVKYENNLEIPGRWKMSPSLVYQTLDDSGELVRIIAKRDVFNGADIKIGEKILLVQTLYITQNYWGNPLLNKWNGNLIINEKDNYILSAMMGAGIKHDNNSFSGVLMGRVGNDNGSEIGLFGYQQGAQSFGFRDDGTAFIGLPGKGRVEFNESGYGSIEGENGNYHYLLQADITKNPLVIGNKDNELFKVYWDGTVEASRLLVGINNEEQTFQRTVYVPYKNSDGNTYYWDINYIVEILKEKRVDILEIMTSEENDYPIYYEKDGKDTRFVEDIRVPLWYTNTDKTELTYEEQENSDLQVLIQKRGEDGQLLFDEDGKPVFEQETTSIKKYFYWNVDSLERYCNPSTSEDSGEASSLIDKFIRWEIITTNPTLPNPLEDESYTEKYPVYYKTEDDLTLTDILNNLSYLNEEKLSEMIGLYSGDSLAKSSELIKDYIDIQGDTYVKLGHEYNDGSNNYFIINEKDVSEFNSVVVKGFVDATIGSFGGWYIAPGLMSYGYNNTTIGSTNSSTYTYLQSGDLFGTWKKKNESNTWDDISELNLETFKNIILDQTQNPNNPSYRFVKQKQVTVDDGRYFIYLGDSGQGQSIKNFGTSEWWQSEMLNNNTNTIITDETVALNYCISTVPSFSINTYNEIATGKSVALYFKSLTDGKNNNTVRNFFDANDTTHSLKGYILTNFYSTPGYKKIVKYHGQYEYQRVKFKALGNGKLVIRIALKNATNLSGIFVSKIYENNTKTDKQNLIEIQQEGYIPKGNILSGLITNKGGVQGGINYLHIIDTNSVIDNNEESSAINDTTDFNSYQTVEVPIVAGTIYTFYVIQTKDLDINIRNQWKAAYKNQLNENQLNGTELKPENQDDIAFTNREQGLFECELVIQDLALFEIPNIIMSLGKSFAIDSEGKIYVAKGKIGSWIFDQNKIMTTSQNYDIILDGGNNPEIKIQYNVDEAQSQYTIIDNTTTTIEEISSEPVMTDQLRTETIEVGETTKTKYFYYTDSIKDENSVVSVFSDDVWQTQTDDYGNIITEYIYAKIDNPQWILIKDAEAYCKTENVTWNGISEKVKSIYKKENGEYIKLNIGIITNENNEFVSFDNEEFDSDSSTQYYYCVYRKFNNKDYDNLVYDNIQVTDSEGNLLYYGFKRDGNKYVVDRTIQTPINETKENVITTSDQKNVIDSNLILSNIQRPTIISSLLKQDKISYAGLSPNGLLIGNYDNVDEISQEDSVNSYYGKDMLVTGKIELRTILGRQINDSLGVARELSWNTFKTNEIFWKDSIFSQLYNYSAEDLKYHHYTGFFRGFGSNNQKPNNVMIGCKHLITSNFMNISSNDASEDTINGSKSVSRWSSNADNLANNWNYNFYITFNGDANFRNILGPKMYETTQQDGKTINKLLKIGLTYNGDNKKDYSNPDYFWRNSLYTMNAEAYEDELDMGDLGKIQYNHSCVAFMRGFGKNSKKMSNVFLGSKTIPGSKTSPQKLKSLTKLVDSEDGYDDWSYKGKYNFSIKYNGTAHFANIDGDQTESEGSIVALGLTMNGNRPRNYYPTVVKKDGNNTYLVSKKNYFWPQTLFTMGIDQSTTDYSTSGKVYVGFMRGFNDANNMGGPNKFLGTKMSKTTYTELKKLSTHRTLRTQGEKYVTNTETDWWSDGNKMQDCFYITFNGKAFFQELTTGLLTINTKLSIDTGSNGKFIVEEINSGLDLKCTATFSESVINFKNSNTERGIFLEGTTKNNDWSKAFLRASSFTIQSKPLGDATNTMQIGQASIHRWTVTGTGTNRKLQEQIPKWEDVDGTGSDIRLKKNIRPIFNISDLYNALIPISFNWKATNKASAGFIAQDIEQLAQRYDQNQLGLVRIENEEPSELIPDGKHYYINYDAFHALHVAKNHEQDARIQALEDEVASLRARIEELQRR